MLFFWPFFFNIFSICFVALNIFPKFSPNSPPPQVLSFPDSSYWPVRTARRGSARGRNRPVWAREIWEITKQVVLEDLEKIWGKYREPRRRKKTHFLRLSA